jgi:hypothetical protein
MTQPPNRAPHSRWAVGLALALGGVLLGLLLIEAIISFFPGLLPRYLRPDPSTLRDPDREDVRVVYRVRDGDLFLAQPGSIAPPENPDMVLANHVLDFDEDGFRRPRREAERYPIIAIGDSFTAAGKVPMPWPDVLADELDTPVKNLGVGGYGPPDYAQVMRLFGSQEPHEWIVIGFYESNDFRAAIDDEEGFTLPEVVRDAIEAAKEEPEEVDYGEGPWKYPVDTRLGSQTRPLVFFEPHLWILNGLPETYADSVEMAELGEHLASIRQGAGDACVLLAYFPGKPHVYFPHVTDPADRVAVLGNARRVDLDDEGRIITYHVPTTRDEIVSRLDSLAMAVSDLARHTQIHFVDVTPALNRAAASGEEMYYPYDSHWSQRGHDVAGQAIAGYIRSHPECETT